MDLAYLERHLSGRSIGWPVRYYDRVPSTQDIAAAEADRGTGEGLLVIAEEQTAGRGRQGRRWWAPPGTAILCSLLLRPRLPVERLPHIGMIAGLAMTDALREVASADAGLKWPNDIWYHGKKLGGILVEARWRGEALQAVVLGTGLNVSTRFPPDSPLYGLATSLAMEGIHVPREPLLVAYVHTFAHYYNRLHAGWSPLDAWRRRLITLGQEVEVHEADGVWAGVAEEVTESGELIVRRGKARVLVRAADVRVRHLAKEQ